MKGQCSQLVCGLWLVVIGLGLFQYIAVALPVDFYGSRMAGKFGVEVVFLGMEKIYVVCSFATSMGWVF